VVGNPVREDIMQLAQREMRKEQAKGLNLLSVGD
jgi:hypothetical protein